MNGRAVWADITEVLAAVEAELPVLVAGLEDRVLARIQARQGRLSARFQEALRRGSSAAVRDALARLRSPADFPPQLSSDLIDLARLCADSRCERSELADVWLVGREFFWEHLHLAAEQTLEDTARCWQVIKAARTRLTGHAARMIRVLGRVWESEVARAAAIHEDRRLRTVSRALEGRWVHPGELGYDLAYHHVAVVADASPPLAALARRAERRVLLVEAPDGAMWGWLGGPTTISNDDLDALVAWQRSRNGEVAFGEPAAGVAGFAASHRQALEARRITAATNHSAVRFGDARLLIALLRDGDLANGMVERKLGGLNDTSERVSELRETLRAYLEHGQSVSAAAAVRRRARKTIQRQVRSAERLMHHPVTDRCDDLLLALRLADILQRRA